MLKQQHKFTELLNNTILILDTIRQTAINGFDDDYYNAYKSLEKIVEMCEFIDYVKQFYSLDNSQNLNNLQ